MKNNIWDSVFPQRISGEITDFTVEGKGVIRHEGMVYFTEGGVIGDLVVAEVLKQKKNFGEARVTEILCPSSFRIPSDCSAFEGEDALRKCGGCDFRNVRYDAQSDWKKRVVLNALHKIGGISDPKIDLFIPAAEKNAYRNHIQLPVRRLGGRVRIGFFAKRSQTVVSFEECRLIPPKVSALIHELEAMIEKWRFPVPDEEDGERGEMKCGKTKRGEMRCGGAEIDDSGSAAVGCLKHLGIRISPVGELVLVFVGNRGWMKHCRTGAEAGASHHEEGIPPMFFSDDFYRLMETYRVISVYENVNPFRHQTFGAEWNWIHGRREWEECILGKRFRLVPASFFQVNRKQTENLYRIAVAYAGEDDAGTDSRRKIGTLLDLYCGVGSIGICASDLADEIIGIELVEEAVQNARKNAEINGVENARYYAGACEDLLHGVLEHVHPEVVILDPPRAGVEAAALDALVRKAPSRIVYVSCNPTTLSRDVKYMIANAYTLKKVSVVDMFPDTTSVECIALLQRGIL